MSIQEALNITKGDVVALVGAGGKTTLMLTLGEELAASGYVTAMTTTTKMDMVKVQQNLDIIIEDDLNKVETILKNRLLSLSTQPKALNSILISSKYTNKLIGVDPSWISRIGKITDIVIIEADGAAKRSFKAPLNHEPVIPPCTDIVITIVGVDIVGRPLTAKYVHRPERVAQLTGLKLGENVDCQTISKVLMHPDGSTRGKPVNASRIYILNKVDNYRRTLIAREIAQKLLISGADKVILTSFTKEPNIVEVIDKRDNPKVAAIILAAGLSKRMGRDKLQLMLGNKTILRHVIDNVLQSDASDVVLVTGPEFKKIDYTSKKYDRLKIIKNDNQELGKSGSIKLGLKQIPDDIKAAIFVMADQPFVTAATINKLINEYIQSRPLILAPVYQGQRGSPVIFDHILNDELTILQGDTGGLEIMEKYKEHLKLVQFDNPLLGIDIDTWDQYTDICSSQRS